MASRDDILSPENTGEDVELLIALLKLASMITRPMREGVAARHDLSTSELRVLMCIGGEGPVAGHDISGIMSIAPMNVSRALAALDKRGWIKRVDNVGNRRRRPVELSSAGWEALGSLIPDVRLIAEHLLSTLRRPDKVRMKDLVGRVTMRISDWEPDDSGPD